MTLTLLHDSDRITLLVDGKPSAYISQTMLQALHDREGGVQQLYPALGVIRTAPQVEPSPF